MHFMHIIYPLKKGGWEESKESIRDLILLPSKKEGSLPLRCWMVPLVLPAELYVTFCFSCG